VPVVAAVEGGRELARRPRVGVAVEDVGYLVRVFAVHAVERQAGEALGLGDLESARARRGHESSGEQQGNEGHDGRSTMRARRRPGK
jgi:hypothetical protein